MKAPFSWPNSSDSSRLSGMAAQLTATNGPLRAAAVAVQEAGHHLLAGAALAGDQDAGLGGGDTGARGPARSLIAGSAQTSSPAVVGRRPPGSPRSARGRAAAAGTPRPGLDRRRGGCARRQCDAVGDDRQEDPLGAPGARSRRAMSVGDVDQEQIGALARAQLRRAPAASDRHVPDRRPRAPRPCVAAAAISAPWPPTISSRMAAAPDCQPSGRLACSARP